MYRLVTVSDQLLVGDVITESIKGCHSTCLRNGGLTVAWLGGVGTLESRVSL